MPATFDLTTRRYLPADGVIDLWVHSGSGSDSGPGTLAAPLASSEEALGRIPSFLWGRRAIVRYLPGHVETLERPLFFPPVAGAGHQDDVALDGVDPAWDYLRSQIVLQAEPGVVETVNGAVAAAGPLYVVTDPSKAWAVNEHVGRGLINPGAPAEHAMIWANTATQLYCTGTAFSDGTLAIVGRDARINVGDGGAFVPNGLMFGANLASVAVVGMTIAANPGAGPAIDVISHGPLAFLLCEIAGGFQCRGGTGQVTVDACYLNGGSFAPNSGTIAVRTSYLRNVIANFHAVNGQYDMFGCRVDGSGPMGHGGTTNPHGGFRVDNCWIANGTGHGIEYRGGNRSRITNTRIDACAGSAVYAEGNGYLLMSGVTGSGSASFGADIDLGANVVPSGNTVSGAQGEVRLGGATFTWAQAPQSNAARMCRFGA